MFSKRTLLIVVAALAFAPAASARVDDQTWTQQPGIVLQPTQAWEGDVVQEPTVIQVGKILHMFYSGGFHECVMGHAVSLDGIHWSKTTGPVLGGGKGGEPLNACHSHVFRDQGKFWAVYSPQKGWGSDESLRLAVSTGGNKWARFEQPILGTVPGERVFGNAFPVWTGGRWVMLFETFTDDDRWETGIATGPDLFHLERDAGKLASLKLTDSSVGAKGGMYGGPWVVRDAENWRVYYHASRTNDNLPTDIYTATSENLRDWTVQTEPVVARSQGWQVDQVADPCVVTVKGRTLMYFDGFDNTEPGHARIGVAVLR